MTSGRKAILVASFGTSYRKAGEAAIGAVEQKIAETFPDYEMRRAFTSQKIIHKLKCRDGEVIDNVKEAVERLEAEGFDTLIVQPTHVMNGYEYEDLLRELAPYQERFVSFACGKPLLSEERDYQSLVKILAEETAVYQGEKTAIVYVGHGTGHAANAVYTKLEKRLRTAGYRNFYIGTVEGTPSLQEAAAAVKQADFDQVVLLPLMIVAGDHACRDIAGDGEYSWKTVFSKEGYRVTCVLKGIGEYQGVGTLLAGHAKAAIEEILYTPGSSSTRNTAAQQSAET